ncbi:hypothetical protein GCM10010206_66170 [Streptomyces cinerochromogenes]|nr:hypothetical protein GCM10010206_66170 [Streptomyces cinerochromogenes]
MVGSRLDEAGPRRRRGETGGWPCWSGYPYKDLSNGPRSGAPAPGPLEKSVPQRLVAFARDAAGG